MQKILTILFMMLSSSAFATDYYCNGQYQSSGSTRYYPNGQYVNSGSTNYYPNGQYVKSGSTPYYPNGQYIKSGSTPYYPNGQYVRSGSTMYYPNGQYVNSGSTCYYQNGQRMGSCPESIKVEGLVGSFRHTLILSLSSRSLGDRVAFRMASSDITTEFTMTLSDGKIGRIFAECSESSQVEEIMMLFNSSSQADKDAVKNRVCR